LKVLFHILFYGGFKMFSKKFNLVFVLVLIFILSVSIVQAAPPAQTPTDDGSSLGDTLDMDKFNLGSVMSGREADDEGTPEATTEPTAEPTTEPTDEPTVEPTDEPTVEPTGEPTAEPTEEASQPHPVASALADYFGVPYDEIMGLHEAGYGFGNIAKAYFFADKLGMTPSELLESAHGSGWGNILKEAGIQHGNGGGKPDHAGKPDKDGPPGQNKKGGNDDGLTGQNDNDNDNDDEDNQGGNDDKGNKGNKGGGRKNK
jgi:hypothetical protein